MTMKEWIKELDGFLTMTHKKILEGAVIDKPKLFNLRRIKLMKKINKLLIVLLFTILLILILQTKSNANTVNKIDMDVYIDNYGNASITEVWNASLTKGTEGYRAYTKLGNSSISNFSVSDDSGRTYETLSNWKTSSSFNDKAYKCGINHTSNGVELCWGISEYGNRKYTLKYEISDFVTQYTDTQGIYFNFLNIDQAVGKATISIHSDTQFSLDNARIWAFGNDGSINFVEGCIVLDSGGRLSSNQYMVALVRFQSNIFTTSNTSNKSFDDIYDSAFSDVTDSDYIENQSDATYDEKKARKRMGIKELIVYLIRLPFRIVISPLSWIIVLVILRKVKGKTWFWGSGKASGQLYFGQDGNVLPNDSQIEYWREVPCNKDLVKAYWVCYEYSVVPKSTLQEGIIGAILLKWIKNGYITVSKTKKGLFSFKDNNYAINFTKMTQGDNEIENELFKMLVTASGTNKILEAKEFSKWSKKHYSEVNYWLRNIEYEAEEYLEQQGLITTRTEVTEAMFGRTKTITIKDVSLQLREEAIRMKGFKKYLLDYSMISQREHIEVHLWEEYLIFAQLLGIADKVEEQFSKLYPNFNQETLLNTEMTTIAIRNMAKICYDEVKYSNYSGSSSSSGGGGSSYSSGGSSSGGSSGGGFR